MSPPNTSLVLVIGAGASKEANLPVGAELKGRIATGLDIRYEHGTRRISGDGLIADALLALVRERSGGKDRDFNPHLRACWQIRDGMPLAASIDNFIDAHRGNTLIADAGKLAIARCILDAEERSSLHVDPRDSRATIEFKNLESTWYNAFFRVLVEGCQLIDMPARISQVAIITFNYDRCIEHYLHSALRNYYGIDAADATQLLTHLRIYHPYGSLGSLPWAAKTTSVAFGAAPSAQELVGIARELKTFTEGTDKSHSDIVAIRAVLAQAERVAFLGFAFNQQNLDLLYGGSEAIVTARSSPVFGTAFGLSPSDVRIIATRLHDLAGHSTGAIDLRRDLTCAQLFNEYGRSLALV